MKLKIFLTWSLLSLGAWAGDDWTLVWSDEFQKDGAPDPTKWGYEEGFVRNREEQYYTRDRRENARVEKGMLVIEARKEMFRNPTYRAGATNWPACVEQAKYTSASLTTRKTVSWKYGRIEVRAQIPHGQGIWPAIWTLGANRGWPACGEIDILEFIGREPNHIYGTVHYSQNGRHESDSSTLTTRAPYDDFHTYAIEWAPEKIDFFFDKKKYHSFSIDKAGAGAGNPFRHPHYLIINLALGGEWGGAADPSVLPQKYLIDYVRVYRRNETASRVSAPENSPAGSGPAPRPVSGKNR